MSTKFTHRCMSNLEQMLKDKDILYTTFFYDINTEKMKYIDSWLYLSSEDEGNVNIYAKMQFLVDSMNTPGVVMLRDKLNYKGSHYNLHFLKHYMKHSKTIDLFISYFLIGAITGLLSSGGAALIINVIFHELVSSWTFHIILFVIAGVLGCIYSVYSILSIANSLMNEAYKGLTDAGTAMRRVIRRSKKSFDDVNSKEDYIINICHKFCSNKKLRKSFIYVYERVNDRILKDIQLHFQSIQEVLDRKNNKLDLDYSPIEEGIQVYMKRIIEDYYRTQRESEQTNIEVVAQCLKRDI